MSDNSLNPVDRARLLDGYWDAVVERLPADSIRIPAADPGDASTVRRIHALAPAAQPSATFSDRLLADLLGLQAAHASTPVESPAPPPTVEQPIMHTIPLDSPLAIRPRRSTKRQPWFARLELAAAVLLIFAFAALAIHQLPDRSPDPVTSIPAVVQTNDASPEATSSDVPIYMGDAGRTGQMPGPGPRNSPDERWRFATGGLIDSGATVVDGTVVIGSNDAHLYALNAATGAQRWAFAASSAVDGSPAIVDGTVYVGSQDGTVYAVDFASGAELWSFPGIREGTSPLVADGKVFVGSWEGNTLYALDAKTGAQIWTLEAAAPFIRVGAYADGTIYYPSREGVLHAVDAASGTERWSFTMDTPTDVNTPVVLNGIVYQPTYQAGSTIYAIDATTGAELWRVSQPQGFRSPAVDGTTVYLPGSDGTILALDARTGAEQWTTALGTTLVASPSLSDGVLSIGGQDGTVFALDAATGTELWRYATDQKIDRAIAVAGGSLYFGTAAGTVYALGAPSSNATPASSAATPTAATPSAGAFDPASVEVVWQSTGGTPGFSSPVGLAQASDGSIYVGNARLQKIDILDDTDGTYLGTASDPSGDPLLFTFTGNLGYNASLGFDADGNLYVVDFNKSLVKKFDPQMNLLLTWGSEGTENGQFQIPIGSVDAVNGRYYVADLVNSRVQVFDLDGNFLDKWGGFGALPGQFNEPGFVTVGPDGLVYVAEYSGDRIQMFDTDGVYRGTIGGPGNGPGQFSQPSSIAFDADGDMVVADFANGRLQIFRPDGSLIGMISSIPGYAETMAPSFVIFDKDGYLHVSDEANNAVVKLKLPPLR